MSATYTMSTPAVLALITQAGGDMERALRALSRAYDHMHTDHRYQHVCIDLRRVLEDAQGIGHQLRVMGIEDAGLAKKLKEMQAA